MHCAFSFLETILAEGRCSLAVDSRAITKGDIFLAVPGENEDGIRYVPDALARGASYVVVQTKDGHLPPDLPELPKKIGLCVVEDMREAIGRLASARYHTNEMNMPLIGVTGTNGKTTVTALLEHLFTAKGYKVGVLGTITYRWPGHSEPAPLTTPDPLSLHAMLAQMNEVGCNVCIMEVSSHALAQKRVDGLYFGGLILTNVTQDHLDFHKTMESYFACKARLFTEVAGPITPKAINHDDPYGVRLLDLFPTAMAYGFTEGHAPRTLQGKLLSNDIHGLTLEMTLKGCGPERSWTLSSPLLGAFNASNLLAVQALGCDFGFFPSELQALASFTGVCGRLERVLPKEGVAPARKRHVFVDYAHTPDALVNVLKAMRDAGFERIITVFGCGGNRDRTKRPLMGEAVAKYADVAVVTSDNPRFEEPEAIIADIMPGVRQARELHVEADRKKATALALDLATGPRDCVLIAGKGHEDYQIVRGVRNHYSDQEVVRELLSQP